MYILETKCVMSAGGDHPNRPGQPQRGKQRVGVFHLVRARHAIIILYRSRFGDRHNGDQFHRIERLFVSCQCGVAADHRRGPECNYQLER